MFRDFLRDLVHGTRLLRRNPGFAIVVTGTLALVIGTTISVFSIVDAWLFRPLNFPRADQLVIAFAARPGAPTEPAVWLPYRTYLGWKERARSFISISAAFVRDVTLTRGLEAQTLLGLNVTPEFFDTFGVAPLLGRTLGPADVHAPPGVVLSYGLWQRQFGGSSEIVGRSVTLSSVPHLVIGVMPREFETRVLDMRFEFWTAFRPDQPEYQPGGAGPVTLIARLADGVALDAARREATVLTRELESTYVRNFNAYVANLTPLQADNTRTVRVTLLTVSAGVLALLLIATINVGALLVGRGLMRMREAAIRAAIGSGRGRLLRQFLTESFLIACIGNFTGIALAHVATGFFVARSPLALPANTIQFDTRAMMASVAVLVLTTILCGILPALRISLADPYETLRTPGSSGVAPPRQHVQLVMLAAQIAACLVLLATAALLTRTFVRLQAEPLGFDPANVQVANIVLPTHAFESGRARYAFYSQLANRVRVLPGVQAVALSSARPLNTGVPSTVYVGANDAPDPPRIGTQEVSAEFFDALRIPLIAGRAFDDRDHRDGAPTLIVNARAAQLLFGETTGALGMRVRLDDEPPREIVGVVGGVRVHFFNTLDWTNDPIVYRPAAQGLNRRPNPTLTAVSFQLHIRSARPLTLVTLRDAVASVDSAAAVTELQPIGDIISVATRQPALRMTLLLAFGSISVLLAAIGVYGAVAQAVSSRIRELAIRLALGAERGALIPTTMRRVLVTAAIGVMVGGATGLLASAWLQTLLYGIAPHDVLSFSFAAATLLTVVGIAAFIPARRATRVDPVSVLRTD